MSKTVLPRSQSIYFVKCMKLLPFHHVYFKKKGRGRTPLWKKHQIQKEILEYYKTIGYNKK